MAVCPFRPSAPSADSGAWRGETPPQLLIFSGTQAGPYPHLGSELGLTRTRKGFSLTESGLPAAPGLTDWSTTTRPAPQNHKALLPNSGACDSKLSPKRRRNGSLRGRILKPSLCCSSFQMDIVFLEVMSRARVFIKRGSGNSASQVTCHPACPTTERVGVPSP